MRCFGWLIVAAFGAGTGVFAAVEPDFLMDSDPDLHVPEAVHHFSPALKSLWLGALNRPEIDMQRMAAETIARGHRFGVPDLEEAVPRLEQILEAPSSHPAARFAAARALIVLDSQSSAEKLFSAAQLYGADFRQLVEPALAEWEYGPAKDAWIKRLSDPQPRLRDMVLALRGLAQVREPSVLPRLLSIVSDSLQDAALRLEAAEAAGQIAETSLEPEAERLAQISAAPQMVHRLCAIRLLARHDSDAARQLLIRLAGDAEPALAGAALHRLNEIDSNLVLPLATAALGNADQRVRLEGATALLKLPSVERIGTLKPLLADAHPGVRRQVCEGLSGLAKTTDWNDAVRQAAMDVLAGDRWQGQEQAALLLGTLEHKPAAGRLVELLESPRKEVMISAAWALRKTAVAETIPAIIDRVQRQTDRRKKETVVGLDDHVVHLFEALGVLKATDAVPLIKQYIPKQPILGERSRSAAIWSLGYIFKEKTDAELENALADRINDFNDVNPESDLVKTMCTVALARMNAVEQAEMLKGHVVSTRLGGRLGIGLRWAVKELTGEVLPPLDPLIASHGHWFLEPYP